MYTLDELREKLLTRYEIDDIIELLDISSEELVDRFEDKVINRIEKLQLEIEEMET
jgi:hypothetical protein|tara:strand:- start:60 stop:227 length:168 start_codon:yes stop_codon:yes gene_type:complete